MDNVTSFLDRSKNFEEAHYSCKELLEERVDRIERFVSKWVLIAIAINFMFMLFGFICLNTASSKIKTKVDHRYFLIKEILEDIHNVKIENGKVIKKYQPSKSD